MTLTEFLLARIAEDEEVAKYDPPHERNCANFDYYDEGGLPCNCPFPAKLLAECQSKRRIVAIANGGCECHASGTGLGNWNWDHQILQSIALPYAEHPDYQQEWLI